MRTFLKILVVMCALAAFAPQRHAQAGQNPACSSPTCNILHSGHARGRIPVACVPIPYVKEGYGPVTMYVLRKFNPADTGTSAELQQQLLDNPIFVDSKVTGPVDNFCRNPKYFTDATWVVICDGKHWGAIMGGALAYAIRNERAWHNLPVLVGLEVPIPKH